MGSNSDYNIIRTPSKTEFDNFVVNTDLNGTLNSDFDTRKINAWNYIHIYFYGNKFVDFATFQDNTNNTSTRFDQNWPGGPIYVNLDKDFHEFFHNNDDVIGANFRPMIEYRE